MMHLSEWAGWDLSVVSRRVSNRVKGKEGSVPSRLFSCRGRTATLAGWNNH